MIRWCDPHLMCDMFAAVERDPEGQRVARVFLPSEVREYLSQIQLKDGSSLMDRDGAVLWGAEVVEAEDDTVVAEGVRGKQARAWMTDKGRRVDFS